MLSKEQEEQKAQEGATSSIDKVVTAICELCSKIGEIDQDVLRFIVKDPNNIPSKSDIVEAYPDAVRNTKMAHNIVELYEIFDLRSESIPQDIYDNIFVCSALRTIIIPETISEIQNYVLDVTSVSEISTSTLDTTMGTNSSTFHGSSEYCE